MHIFKVVTVDSVDFDNFFHLLEGEELAYFVEIHLFKVLEVGNILEPVLEVLFQLGACSLEPGFLLRLADLEPLEGLALL